MLVDADSHNSTISVPRSGSLRSFESPLYVNVRGPQLLKIPGHAAHDKAGISRHEVNVLTGAASFLSCDANANMACLPFVLNRF